MHNGQLYIRSYADPGFSRGPATLAQLHQAIRTSPEPIPNVELCFGLEDRPAKGTFGLDRPANPTWWFLPDRATSKGEVWLTPDFGFFTWPEHVGSYRFLRSQTAKIEASTPWTSKIPKLLWRGSLRVGAHDRRALLATTDPYRSTWSDVRELNWDTRDSLVPMPDHCRWKYNVVPEGTTYTGRLRNLANCRSVIVMHQPTWVTFWMHLLNPDPTSTDQNVVYVPSQPWYKARLSTLVHKFRLRWAQLPKVMENLQSNDDRAQRIAQNQWSLLRQRYLTPANVACTWRRTLRAYDSVSEVDVVRYDTDLPFTHWVKTLPEPIQQALQDASYISLA